MLFIMQLVLFNIRVFLCIVVLSLANNNNEICTLQVAESFLMFPGFELPFGSRESSKEKAYLIFSKGHFILMSVWES